MASFQHTTSKQETTTKLGGGSSYEKLSRLLDSSIPLPGGFRIGVDGILGLIPGVGDALGGLLSSIILYQAYQRNVPKMVLLRMLLNVIIDAFLGAIPLLGDLFDFFWKANEKNARLLNAYQHNPKQTYRRSAVGSMVILAAIVLLMLTIVYLTIASVAFVWQQIT
jgi:hypothetical protein